MPKDPDENANLGLKLNSRLVELLAKLQEVELEDFEMDVGDLEIWLQPGAVAAPTIARKKTVPALKAKPLKIVETNLIALFHNINQRR